MFIINSLRASSLMTLYTNDSSIERHFTSFSPPPSVQVVQLETSSCAFPSVMSSTEIFLDSAIVDLMMGVGKHAERQPSIFIRHLRFCQTEVKNRSKGGLFRTICNKYQNKRLNCDKNTHQSTIALSKGVRLNLLLCSPQSFREQQFPNTYPNHLEAALRLHVPMHLLFGREQLCQRQIIFSLHSG